MTKAKIEQLKLGHGRNKTAPYKPKKFWQYPKKKSILQKPGGKKA